MPERAARFWLRTCINARTVQLLRPLSHKQRREVRRGSGMKARRMSQKAEWVIWNGGSSTAERNGGTIERIGARRAAGLSEEEQPE